MKKVSLFLFIFLFIFCSCDIGLGNAVDLEAPEITITSPKDNANVHKNIILRGICKDNIKVKEVEIVEQKNDNSLVLRGYGVIEGDEWSCEVNLDEGECFLICTAKDEAGNSSPKSKAVITLTVDETAAQAQDWYIDRGKNIQVPFYTKEELEEVDCNLVLNKFVPQNEQFSISGTVYDAISVAKVVLKLYEDNEETPFITKSIDSETITTGSIYSPSISFTHNELINIRPSLSSGKHYLRASYEVYDDAGNSSEGNVGYLLWYPESDSPGIEQDDVEDEYLIMNVGSIIPVYFYDDDSISEVRYALITEDEKNQKGISIENMMDYVGEPDKDLQSGLTEYPVQIKTTTIENGVENALTSGTYYILLYIKDINGKEKKRFITVSLRDVKNPVIRIISPKENEKPEMIEDENSVANSFNINGVVTDSTGCKYVKVAFIPESENGEYKTSLEKQARAKELFNNAESKDDEFVREYVFESTEPKPKSDGMIEEKFDFTFNLLDDFPSDKNKSKFFMFVVEDLDGNQVFKQWIVGADSDKPEFKFVTPNDMSVIDYYNSDLTFVFKAVKSSGLGIQEDSYEVTREGEKNCVYTFENGKLQWQDDKKEYIKLTIQKSELEDWAEGRNGFNKDSAPIFNFRCEDILGNEGSARMTIVLSPLPALESITADQRSGIYGAGTELSFQAKFSDSVRVTGKPKLKLAGIKNDSISGDVYAVCESSDLSDTLTFTYNTRIGDYCENGDYIYVADDCINLNGGKIETGTQGNGDASISFVSGQNFWDSTDSKIKKEIQIDGISPYLKKFAIKVNDTVIDNNDYYANANTNIFVTVTFSESVSVSGNVNLLAQIGSGESKIHFTQYSMNSIGDEITYLYTVESDKNGELTFAGFSDTTGIKDKAGNTLAEYDNKKINIVLDTIKPNKPSIKDASSENSGNNLSSGVYNKPPKFTVSTSNSDIEKTEVSIDNGQSWIDLSKNEVGGGNDSAWNYTDGVFTIIDNGTYNIIARVTDKAGNVSDNTDTISVILNQQFPEILDIKIACENGNYKKGSELIFKIFLSDTLKPYSETDASITITSIKDPSITKEINAVPSGENNFLNYIEFKHIVDDNDNFEGIHISKVNLEQLQDKYNNNQDDITKKKIAVLTAKPTDGSDTGCYRRSIYADGKAPKIDVYSPNNNGVGGVENTPFEIKLTFSEKVYKEAGTITLRRKGEWAIPPVLTVSDFNKVYNSSKLTSDDKEILMRTINGNGTGNELLDARTGIASGPYKKITNGLKVENGYYVPDTDTKYVLDFNLGLYAGSTLINPYGEKKTADVANIRKVFEKTGYHEHTWQVNSSYITINNNEVTITIPKNEFYDSANYTDGGSPDTNHDNLADGIEWELIISDGAFRDNVGNLYKGLQTGDYTLWSDIVSKPVVRVDRYSHGYGAIEPNSTDSNVIFNETNKDKFTDINVWTQGGKSLGEISESKKLYDNTERTGGRTKPTGYVRVRIDSQTPGATLNYKTFNTGAFDVTTGAVAKDSLENSIAWTKYKLDNGINSYSSSGTSGDSNYTFGEISDKTISCTVSEIVDATLEKIESSFTGNSQTNNAGIIIIVGDGEYKTARKDYVVAYGTHNSLPTMDNSENGAEGVFKTVVYSKNYEGNNQFSIEGGTFMGGEPTVSGFPVRDGESAQYSKNAYHIPDTDKENIWVSYEIVSTNWAVLLREKVNSKNYPRSSYGQATYTNGYIHY